MGALKPPRSLKMGPMRVFGKVVNMLHGNFNGEPSSSVPSQSSGNLPSEPSTYIVPAEANQLNSHAKRRRIQNEAGRPAPHPPSGLIPPQFNSAPLPTDPSNTPAAEHSEHASIAQHPYASLKGVHFLTLDMQDDIQQRLQTYEDRSIRRHQAALQRHQAALQRHQAALQRHQAALQSFQEAELERNEELKEIEELRMLLEPSDEVF